MKKYIFIITLIITGLFFQFLPNSTMTKKEIKNNPLLEGNFELTSEKEDQMMFLGKFVI